MSFTATFKKSKGPYIKYVGEGTGGFCWGQEIFLKIFNGPQNIFLCVIFVILFLS